MVELTASPRGGYRLEGYAIAPLPKDAMVDGNIGSLDHAIEAMRFAWKLLGSREKRVAMALPSASVITKRVMMSSLLTEDEMEAQVEAEANQYIPFPLDEVNIDFQILGSAGPNTEDVSVLIAAARKEKIEDRLAVAEGAGLKALVMDVESYATEAVYNLIATQLPDTGKNQTVMMVDIGATTTHVNVLHNNQSVYTREQTFGGNQLTQEIQRRFGLSADEAEMAKRKGGLPESYESEVLEPFMQLLATEVARAIQFFVNSTQFTRVDHVVLAGGCASITAIDLMVQDRTQVNTIVANPFGSMSTNPKLKSQQIASDAPALLIACGLAMRGLHK